MRLASLFAVLAIGLGHATAAWSADPQGWYDTPYGWSMTDKLSAAGGCGARLPGEQVDTLLTVNKTDHVILMAGKRNWNMEPGQHEVALRIDDHPPMTIVVLTVVNLVVTQIQDRATEQQLRKATMLSWRFPKGTYRAAVHDIGPVIDALKDCNRRQRPG